MKPPHTTAIEDTHAACVFTLALAPVFKRALNNMAGSGGIEVCAVDGQAIDLAGATVVLVRCCCCLCVWRDRACFRVEAQQQQQQQPQGRGGAKLHRRRATHTPTHPHPKPKSPPSRFSTSASSPSTRS